MDLGLPSSSFHGIFQARILEWVAISFSRGSSQLRNRTWVSCVVHIFFTNWATREALIQWKWKSLNCVQVLQPHEQYSPWNSPGQNTGVGSHSLLQGIFPTQMSNQGLLHYRWILYQMSHQECSQFLFHLFWGSVIRHMGFPGGSVVKNPPANAGGPGFIPRSGRSPGEGTGYKL